MYENWFHEIQISSVLKRTFMLISCMTHSWMYINANRNGDVRLSRGRLEVFYSGVWGTVCDDHFSDVDARVACRTYGYSAGVSLGNIVSAGSGQIWMDEVSCIGSERRLSDCGHNGWGKNDCTHSEDVGIRCYNKVNGGWSAWYSWSSCSSSCGRGTQYRYRRCNGPVPNNDGSYCPGLPFQRHSCLISSCRVNGGWSAWLSWSSCSSTCGTGKQYRYRHCNSPVPINGGSYCSGSPFETQICNSASCRENGGWNVWLSWSNCSSSCGNDTRYRYRRCNRPVPHNGGSYCSGLPFEKQRCNSTECEEMVGQYLTQDKEKCCSLETVAGVGAGCIVFAIISVGLFCLIRRKIFCSDNTEQQGSSNIYDNPGQPPRQAYDNVVYTTEADVVGDIADDRTNKNCETKKQIVYENLEI